MKVLKGNYVALTLYQTSFRRVKSLWMSAQLFYKQKELRVNEVPSRLLVVYRFVITAIVRD